MFQAPGENISQFVDRLQIALEKQMQNPEARNDALISVLQTNTIPSCGQAIATLPKRPKPTLGDIIEVCMQIPLDPIPPSPRKMGSHAFPNFSKETPGTSAPPTPPRKCFNCGEMGHFAKNSPRKSIKTITNPTHPRDSVAGNNMGNI